VQLDKLASFVDSAYAAGAVDGRPLAPHSVDRADGEALRDLAVAEGASRTIEVGLALGMSALFLCQAIAGRDGARHVAIDPFQAESWDNAGLEALREAEVEELVEVIQEESLFALPQLVKDGRQFDFAFVDGDHRFEGVVLDLVFMARLVKPGGLIVVDDMWMPAVRLAVSYVEKNLDLELEPDALPNGFSWGRRSRLSRGVPRGSGDLAVLRNPVDPPPRPWDRFEPFF
jgi:predicted O-methyltransferase YrrM